MTTWWAARLNVSDVRRALRDMIECDDHADAARAALTHLRGVRGTLHYLDAAGGLGGDVEVKAVLAEAGARVLGEEG